MSSAFTSGVNEENKPVVGVCGAGGWGGGRGRGVDGVGWVCGGGDAEMRSWVGGWVGGGVGRVQV